ncbi:hypothetical protein J437_LFUL017922 [Ladona fulva]|uniref:Homeobox domain-containing protein n=1 Tax=Ladona fulva TaxID=123851 RepID=A0A8K0PBV4_LADFU|nr:hypothetical protein J437_LFUL017922 [Ladona fulva]
MYAGFGRPIWIRSKSVRTVSASNKSRLIPSVRLCPPHSLARLSYNSLILSFAGPDIPGFLLQPFRKPKRIRTAFSPSQLLKLEHAFEKNHYVVGAERKQLAQSLSLTETQVRKNLLFTSARSPMITGLIASDRRIAGSACDCR